MAPIIERIVAALSDPENYGGHPDALRNAGYLFEKFNGLPGSGWPDEVAAANVSDENIARLQRAVVAYVEREGVGTWALSKCDDPALKPVLLAVLRRQLEADADELFQAMIALQNLGEPVFGDDWDQSILDQSRNRELAREYLSRYR